jgi:NAD(P)-dependent dehydrogenase (short-subunit alcohol dehydrogenase family)
MGDTMKTIVITGSTRGIGLGLATALLERGCQVVISGRAQETVDKVVTELEAEHGPDRVLGKACDVTELQQVQALWDTAQARFGRIDVWINNAGIAHGQTDFWDYDPGLIASVVETNVIGAMYGAKVAVRGMLAQGSGHFYNMEGLGSDGRRVEGLTLYGTTKRALAYLTDALVEETKGTPIVVGALRPGMVTTDMLTTQYEGKPEEWESAKRIFNILADRVEMVTPWLADKVLGNKRTGVRFSWLSRGKVLGRFLLAPFRRRDLFGEPDGDR